MNSSSSEIETDTDIEHSPSSTTGSDNDPSTSQDWHESKNSPSLEPPSDRFPFVESNQMGFNYDPAAGILQFLEAYFDDDLINYICTETNRYASQLSISRPPTSCRALRENWKEVEGPELRIFLMLYALQGIIKMPEQEFHWSTRNILHCPFFGRTMSLKRYNAIKKNLHFSNNTTYDPETHPCPKLNKIWPVYEKLEEKFSKLYSMDMDVTIDESLLLYKGNLGWKQCILSTRARFGIKIYALCESKSGYIWKSIIYTGKGTTYDSDFSQHSMSEQVVMSLMKPLLDKGYCLTTDNFYMSQNLTELLTPKQTDTQGTVGKKRKNKPPDLKKQKLTIGNTIAYKKGKAIVLTWKDKKDATLLSTVNTNMVEIEKRNTKTMKPKVVVDCNGTFPRKKGKKYYKKIFFHLFEIALWNSYVLYKKSGGKSTNLNYRLDVIEQSVDKYIPSVTSIPRVRPSANTHPRRLTERHFIEEIPSTETQTHPRRKCHLCCRKSDASGKKIRKDTKFYCPDCNVPLCLPCFKIYHTTNCS